MNSYLLNLSSWGCDIEAALPRFLNDEQFLLECILQVSDDPAFEMLRDALDHDNAQDAFDAAHTLKGVLANTGLAPLYDCIVRIVESLRAGRTDGLQQVYAALMDKREQLKNLLA